MAKVASYPDVIICCHFDFPTFFTLTTKCYFLFISILIPLYDSSAVPINGPKKLLPIPNFNLLPSQ